MYIQFDQLSDSSKIWIYQSNRPFTETEKVAIVEKGKQFIDQWTAHGKDLKSSLKIVYDQFLILGVDENLNQATGCSIDASVNFFRSISAQLGVDLFDRTQIAFIFKGKLQIESLSNFKSKVKSGELSDDIEVFNNAITCKGELSKAWLTPLSKSWAARFIPTATM